LGRREGKILQKKRKAKIGRKTRGTQKDPRCLLGMAVTWIAGNDTERKKERSVRWEENRSPMNRPFGKTANRKKFITKMKKSYLAEGQGIHKKKKIGQ